MVMVMLFGTIALSLMGMYAFRTVDPYVEKVFALPGNATQGQAIFQMNCATCHGILGYGLVGPSLKEVSHRKSQAALIEQVISGKTPPMPQFQPNAQEMADLLSYLQSL